MHEILVKRLVKLAKETDCLEMTITIDCDVKNKSNQTTINDHKKVMIFSPFSQGSSYLIEITFSQIPEAQFKLNFVLNILWIRQP